MGYFFHVRRIVLDWRTVWSPWTQEETQNPIERMCLKYLPNTTRGIKPMTINLINEMEMKNAAYAADLFAIEKNGLN